MSLFQKRMVRRNGGNPYTSPLALAIANRQAARQAAVNTSGGVSDVTPVKQGRLQVKTVEVVMTYTNSSSPTASATPIIFDSFGILGHNLTNITVSGDNGANTESILRSISGPNSWMVQRVTLIASSASVLTNLNWKVLQATIHGASSTEPIKMPALKSPTNYDQTILILKDLNLKINAYIAWQFTLAAAGDFITFVFNVPAQTNATLMSN